MQTEPIERFETTISEYGVDITRASAENATAVIDDLVEPPAVGAPLSSAGVDLPESVTTEPTPTDLESATTGVSEASLGIASYGSLALRADEAGSEPVSLFVDHHVAVLDEDDIVPDMVTAFDWLGDELRSSRDSIVLATGPSATADMGSLVQGAHGPKTVDLVLLS